MSSPIEWVYAVDADMHDAITAAFHAEYSTGASYLVDTDVDISEAVQDGITPLHVAARISSSDMARLIKAGADVNAMDCQGRTPLHHNVASGESRDAHILVAAGADINAADHQGNTPLHYYFTDDSEWTSSNLPELIALGADVAAKNENGDTPLHAAAGENERTLKEFLLTQSDLEATNDAGDTPLHIAAACRAVNIVPLIDAGADVTASNFDGNTPLHMATATWSESEVAALIAAGADEYAKNSRGETPDGATQSLYSYVLQDQPGRDYSPPEPTTGPTNRRPPQWF